MTDEGVLREYAFGNTLNGQPEYRLVVLDTDPDFVSKQGAAVMSNIPDNLIYQVQTAVADRYKVVSLEKYDGTAYTDIVEMMKSLGGSVSTTAMFAYNHYYMPKINVTFTVPGGAKSEYLFQFETQPSDTLMEYGYSGGLAINIDPGTGYTYALECNGEQAISPNGETRRINTSAKMTRILEDNDDGSSEQVRGHYYKLYTVGNPQPTISTAKMNYHVSADGTETLKGVQSEMWKFDDSGAGSTAMYSTSVVSGDSGTYTSTNQSYREYLVRNSSLITPCRGNRGRRDHPAQHQNRYKIRFFRIEKLC